MDTAQPLRQGPRHRVSGCPETYSRAAFSSRTVSAIRFERGRRSRATRRRRRQGCRRGSPMAAPATCPAVSGRGKRYIVVSQAAPVPIIRDSSTVPITRTIVSSSAPGSIVTTRCPIAPSPPRTAKVTMVSTGNSSKKQQCTEARDPAGCGLTDQPAEACPCHRPRCAGKCGRRRNGQGSGTGFWHDGAVTSTIPRDTGTGSIARGGLEGTPGAVYHRLIGHEA